MLTILPLNGIQQIVEKYTFTTIITSKFESMLLLQTSLFIAWKTVGPVIFCNKPLYRILCRDIWYDQQRWLCYMRIINRIFSLYIFKVTKRMLTPDTTVPVCGRYDMGKFLLILLAIWGFCELPFPLVCSTVYYPLFISNLYVSKKWLKSTTKF